MSEMKIKNRHLNIKIHIDFDFIALLLFVAYVIKGCQGW
ncbi:hypothetical protein EV692_1795 [Lonepinella koalarum]|uniref:Uncharacterized protein n=1 Tax=Lonepinella koalarum TaxID=53417 RepID=A0A4R1KSR2_9PAST|nr:hypothetical protein EV692_1795 [Lonepinella koalarum]